MPDGFLAIWERHSLECTAFQIDIQARALVPLRGKVYCQGSRFPETATTSLGVLQPWPLPSSRPVSPEIRLP